MVQEMQQIYRKFGLRVCTLVGHCFAIYLGRFLTGSTDIGGGAIDDNELNTPTLSRIPLRWMVRECFECNTGIIFDACMLQEAGLPIHKDNSTEDDFTYQLAPSYPWSSESPNNPPKQPDTTSLDAVPGATVGPYGMFLTFMFGSRREQPASKPDKFVWRELSADYENKQDLRDIHTNIHCQLEERPLWHILELIPQRVERQTTMVEKLEKGDSYQWV